MTQIDVEFSVLSAFIVILSLALLTGCPMATPIFCSKLMSVFRNKAVDKWQRRTQVTTGAAAIKGKLHAFNQNVSEQVASYMRDPSRMIKQMQQSRSTVAVFGSVPREAIEPIPEEKQQEGDPELVEDAEFYRQLLKEFLETIDPASSEAAFYETKKRKIVDRRVSKSRKIRYNVHEKIVNFMAPRPPKIPPNTRISSVSRPETFSLKRNTNRNFETQQ